MRLLARRPDGIFVAPTEQGEIGPDLFRAACNMGLEKRAKPPTLATYYDHRVHQILPMTSEPHQDFISEDDLDTFEGYLRYQAIDPTTATPEVLASFRETFEEAQKAKATTRSLVG